MALKNDAKFKEKLNEKFSEFSTRHSKVLKFNFDELFLSKVYKV